jgi:hypothetical protein
MIKADERRRAGLKKLLKPRHGDNLLTAPGLRGEHIQRNHNDI